MNQDFIKWQRTNLPALLSAGFVENAMKTDSLECVLQPRPVCPHCGYRHDDAWEWNFGPGLDGRSDGRTCYHCDGEFDCERVVDVSYTTKKVAQHGTT